MKKLLALLLLPTLAMAHTATLLWTASTDGAAVAYNVYRATGACPASGEPASPTLIASTAAGATSYSDITVVSGTYCYFVRASLSGNESADSNFVQGIVPLAPATGLTVVVK